jgi:hypothetical protein
VSNFDLGNRAQLISALIESGRVSIIPVGFEEEGEGDGEEDGEEDGGEDGEEDGGEDGEEEGGKLREGASK